MFDLNDLAIFVQIADAGSFAKVARSTGAPSNTLSRRIKLLEESLGARLLHRSTRKLTLTDAGKLLYKQSASPVNALIEVSRQLVDQGQEPAGRIRVAAHADFFEVFQMEFVAGFLARHPKTQVDFVLGDQHNDLIAEGIDIAFRSGAMRDSALIVRKIGAVRRILAASPEYLKNFGLPTDVHSLNQHNCISFSHPSSQLWWDLVGPDGSARVEISCRFQASTAQAQIRAAMAGLGICLMPESLMRSALHSKQLVHVLPEYGHLNNDLSVVLPSRRHIPLAVSRFADEAVAHLVERLANW
ncbi:LysR family transcriptional regulator [Pseudomonas sp. S2_H01]